MIPEIEELRGQAMHRYHTDPRFHARVTLAVRMEEELDRGRHPADRSYRHERLERLVTVLHGLDQDEEYWASIRVVGQ